MKSGEEKESNCLLSEEEVRAIIIALAKLIVAEGGGDIKFKPK